MLEGIGVTKRFGGLTAISKFDFRIGPREIVGLIGPNGSGKTTLFNLISGFYRPDEGRIRFNGEDISHLSPSDIAKLGIGRTFQIVRPLMEISTLDNVAVSILFGEGIRSLEEARQKAAKLLQFTGLQSKQTLQASKLKLADRKRLEMTRALGIKPKVLLLDEVFSGLNQKEIDDAIQMIFRIRNEMGISIFIIEHVMKALMTTCDRIIALHFGVKVTEGPPEWVANHPKVIEAYLGAEDVSY